MSCGKGANAFIEKYFFDCVYNVRDYIGFCLGLTAILFWVVAQIPQYVRNYKTKSAEALSPWFLAQWLLGDTFNLLGCLLQGQQLPTTTYTAMYFVVADVFMMMQYIYYGALQRRREKVLQLQARRRHHHRRHQHHSSTSQRSPGPSSGHQHAAGDDSSKEFGGQWQRQQHDRQQLPVMPPSGDHDMEYGIDGSTKQQHMQQQQLGQVQQHADASQLEQEYCLGSKSSAAGSSTGGGGSSSSMVGSSHAPAAQAAVLPSSCAAAAAAAGADRHWAGGVNFGGNRSVLAVGILVSLGLVSLLVPANSTHGLFPSASGGAAAAANARTIQAGVFPTSSMHSSLARDSSSAAGSAAAAAAAAGFAGHLTKPPHSSSSSSGSSSSVADGDQPVSPPERDWAFVIGTGLGYCSSVLYLCSRISQIHKNYTRKSSEGLALAMFMMAVCANLCTGIGIMMRTFTVQELKEQLPWIIGSLGTIMLDMIILWQSLRYGNKAGPAVAAGAGDHHHQQQQQHYRHHQVTHHLYQQQHHQQAARPGHAAASGEVLVGAAAYYQQEIRGAAAAAAVLVGSSSAALLSSSAPVGGAAWGTLSHRQGPSSAVGRRQAMAATVDHLDGAEVMVPLLPNNS